MEFSNKEKISKIYELLPQLNCGFCGFGNCGQFAKAIVEGRASPFGCKQNPSSGFQISEIIGEKVSGYSEGVQAASRALTGVSTSTQTLKEELRALSRKTGDILARLEKL
ncbi:MAG: hypothetical protein IMY88_05535 [Chloroflexi bacterium]|nr:hypothetical protein [Chloroflexota bacterium]